MHFLPSFLYLERSALRSFAFLLSSVCTGLFIFMVHVYYVYLDTPWFRRSAWCTGGSRTLPTMNWFAIFFMARWRCCHACLLTCACSPHPKWGSCFSPHPKWGSCFCWPPHRKEHRKEPHLTSGLGPSAGFELNLTGYESGGTATPNQPTDESQEGISLR